MTLHNLLERQISKAKREDGVVDLDKLSALVSAAYDEFDRDHARNERVNGLMVEEMEELNADLQTALRRVQNRQEWFEAAMDNMVQGLSLYSSEGNLIVFNERYANIYGLRGDQLKVGMHMTEIRTLQVAAGLYDAEEGQKYIDSVASEMAEHTGRSTFVRRVGDGREIEINCQPLPRGGYLTTHSDITARLNSERKITHMANHDSLTGLPNRFMLQNHLQDVINKAKATGGNMAVLYIDLDGFKDINDTLGHQAGDEVLEVIAKRLNKALDKTSVLGRLSGDEFMVVVSQFEEPAQLARLADVLMCIAARPVRLGENWISLTAGIGIAMGPGIDGQMETLIRNADMALYRVKDSGGAGYRFFEPEMDAEARERRQLSADLRRAVSHGELAMYYQPIVDLRTGVTAGYESLLRWNHPELGMITPPRFIDIAESTGQIAAIGEWALKTACSYAASWKNGEKVAVNLSPLQFKYQDVVALVKSVLDETGLDPRRLELEITESVLIHNPDSVAGMIQRLSDLGVGVALDDFGTGFSSLSYLANFSFQKIKIDKSFTRDMANKSEIVAIVGSIIGLGRTLGTTITAEGIEEQSQHDLLKAAGCTQGQGYLYGVPQPEIPKARKFAVV